MKIALKIWILAQLINAVLFALYSLAQGDALVFAVISFVLGLPSILSFTLYLYLAWKTDLNERYIHYFLAGFPMLTLINAISPLLIIGMSMKELFMSRESFIILLFPAASAWAAAYLCAESIRNRMQPYGNVEEHQSIQTEAETHDQTITIKQSNMQTDTISFWEKNKMLIKGLLIGFLILIMMIPTVFLLQLVNERQNRQNEVMTEVSNKWGGSQLITGPVIAVPYFSKDGDVKKTAYYLPEHLSITGNITPEVRHRSLYDVKLYSSELTLSGKFNPVSAQELQIPAENMYWNEAHLIMGIGDAKGLEEEVAITLNGQTKMMEAGTPDKSLFSEGLNIPLSIDPKSNLNYNIHVKIKGSSDLHFVPVGKTTEVSLRSPWKDPAFDGQYLPSRTPDVTGKGFTAYWKVLQVSRSFPQSWKDGNYDISKSSFGVKLVQPTDGYAMTERCVKYAILFIALTFTVFFFMEIMQKVQVHPLQYILVGFALCIFYTLLLSISEYAGFNTAYLIASSATVLLVGMYVWGIFKKLKIALGFTTALAGLYGYIFILIQLQDYALIFGSIGLFLILAVIMFYSTKIDWYGFGRQIKEVATH